MTVAYQADQLDLLAEPRHRATDPETSVVAAERLKKNNRLHVSRVAEIVATAGERGCIADEVHAVLCQEDETYWRPRRSTVHARVSNAFKAGLIVRSGVKHGRLSVLNEIQAIYVAPNLRGNHG